jgi:hypothetical protein
VVGALIGSLLGAVLGGTLASRAAKRAAREAWSEEERRALVRAWTDLHRAANRGSWAFSDLLEDEPEKGEGRRQRELWADFWRHCKLVSARAATAGYPAAGKVLWELTHFEDIRNTDARYEVAMKVAEMYIEDADAAEKRVARDPKGFARQMVLVASAQRAEPGT